jgi:hypothetical protein
MKITIIVTKGDSSVFSLTICKKYSILTFNFTISLPDSCYHINHLDTNSNYKEHKRIVKRTKKVKIFSQDY